MGWNPSYDPRQQALTAFCEGVIQTRALVDRVIGGKNMAEYKPVDTVTQSPAMVSGIWKKLASVMSKVDRIPKNGFNSFHKYNYATEADITEAVRGILATEGIAFLPSVIEWERGEADGKGNCLTRVAVRFTLADTETGHTVESVFWGEGQDNMDKGFYKAYTGAVKYFLLKTLLIPTGDDPEDDGGKQSAPPKQQAPAKNPNLQREKPQQQRPVGVNVSGPVPGPKVVVDPVLVGQTIATAVDAGLTLDNLQEFVNSSIRPVKDLTELTTTEFDKVLAAVGAYIKSKDQQQ